MYLNIKIIFFSKHKTLYHYISFYATSWDQKSEIMIFLNNGKNRPFLMDNWNSAKYFLYCLKKIIHKFSVQEIIYNVQYTVYNAQYTVYNVQYTVYNVQCTVQSVQCTVYSTKCTMYSVQYRVYNVHYTVQSVHCTLMMT